MEDVEKTDRLGALRVLLRLRKYLQEYEEERDKILSLPPTPDDNIIAKKDQYAREYREEKLEANWSREHQKSKPLFRKFGQIPKELQGLEELTESQLDEIVSEGKELGEREFQEVREKLTETTNKLSPLPANVVKLGRGKFNRTILDEIKIDTTLSKRLRSTLFAIVVFPDADKPVNQTTPPVWPLLLNLSSVVTSFFVGEIFIDFLTLVAEIDSISSTNDIFSTL